MAYIHQVGTMIEMNDQSKSLLLDKDQEKMQNEV
jgi:hypothetical protein